jgi:predicted anti-sigma-YlaC factor YlaD
MNCTQTRFLLYAHLDREVSSCEAEALSRHLAECGSCAARARSARGLANLLRSHMDRTPAPPGLVVRLRRGDPPHVRPRVPAFAIAAVLLVVILPVVADGPGARPAAAPAIALSSTAPSSFVPAAAATSPNSGSRRILLTGTLVCLQCETRHEAGLCPLPESHHEPGFCADNGEVWQLMLRDPSIAQAAVGQTVTVEGVGFPRSGFLRASRVGY